MISRVGFSWRRFPRDGNPERLGLKKGIGTRGSIIGWLMPTGEEIASKASISMAES